MKLKKWVLGLFVIGGCFMFSLAFAETLEELSNDVFSDPRQPSVGFMHDEHNDMAGLTDCAVCHHLYEGRQLIEGESSEDMSCSECHPPVNFSKGVSLTAAYHKRCKGCHLSIKQGPIVCGQCHLKEFGMREFCRGAGV